MPDSLVPQLIPGGLAIDDRGHLMFNNQFDPVAAGIRRFYLTSNHRVGTVRAWHAHRREGKYVAAVSGSALVCAIKVDEWIPQPRLAPKDGTVAVVPSRFVLSADKPAVLAIPPGYANGWMSLTPDCRLAWFSTATLAESAGDDVRFPARYWDCWNVEER